MRLIIGLVILSAVGYFGWSYLIGDKQITGEAPDVASVRVSDEETAEVDVLTQGEDATDPDAAVDDESVAGEPEPDADPAAEEEIYLGDRQPSMEREIQPQTDTDAESGENDPQ